jgi:hypothetical protein
MSSYSNYLGAKKCCATNLVKTVIGPQGPQGARGPIGPYGQLNHYFAQYINTVDQGLVASSPANVVLDTNVYQNGITRSGSDISFNKAGTYKVGVSLLAAEIGGSGADLFFSFTDNVGVVANSSSVLHINGNNQKTLGYAEILYTATETSTIRCVVYTTSSGITLKSYPSPNSAISASPSIIMTIYQIT